MTKEAAFTLDTSGRVECNDPSKPCICHSAHWEQLSPFAQGYITALFEAVQVDALGATPAERPTYAPRFSDLSPEALALIMADCERFLSEWTGIVADAEAGGAFYRIRQGDRADIRLKRYAPLRVYLDNAGKVQVEPA